MRLIKLFIVSVLIFCILGFLLSLMLPSNASSERSGSINAPTSTVYEQISNFKNWHNWNPWSPGYNDKSGLTLKSMSTPSHGVGATFTYVNTSNQEEGTVKILESDPATGIKYEVTFQGMKPMIGTIQIKPTTGDANGTAIRWVLETNVGMMPWWKVRGFVMDRLYGPYIEQGLNHLSTVCETGSK